MTNVCTSCESVFPLKHCMCSLYRVFLYSTCWNLPQNCIAFRNSDVANNFKTKSQTWTFWPTFTHISHDHQWAATLIWACSVKPESTWQPSSWRCLAELLVGMKLNEEMLVSVVSLEIVGKTLRCGNEWRAWAFQNCDFNRECLTSNSVHIHFYLAIVFFFSKKGPTKQEKKKKQNTETHTKTWLVYLV